MDVSERILQTWMPAIHAGMADKKAGRTLALAQMDIAPHIFMFVGRA
jgi:hypothetical protein